MRNTVHNVGRAGLVKDVKPHLLPSEFWTDARNVRFDPNKVFLMGGVQTARTKANLLSCQIFTSPSTNFLVYSTGGKVYAWDGTTESDITRAVGGDYLDSTVNQFELLSFNGYAILNNGINVPQLWGGSFVSGPMVALTNWNATWQTKKLRSFKSFLIALNMTEGGIEYPHKMRWSTPAEPGAVPATWDPSIATAEAGEFSFSDVDKGKLVDGLALGDRFFVYKEGAIWGFDYVGGQLILSRNLIKSDIGLTVPRSLTNIPFFGQSRSSVQFFVGDENFYIMDGVRTIPVWEEVMKNEILATVNQDAWQDHSFSVINYAKNELWFCVPEAGETLATLAYVLNYKNGTSTIRELNGATTIVSGLGYSVSQGDQEDPISFSDDTFFSDNTGFFSTVSNPNRAVIIEACPGTDTMYYLDTGMHDYDGTAYTGYVSREALATVKNDSRNEKADIVDYNRRKLVPSITPKLYSGSVSFSIGVQEKENVNIAWTDLGPLTVENYKYFLPFPVSGRFISFKFSSVEGQHFELGGFDYEVAMLGEY